MTLTHREADLAATARRFPIHSTHSHMLKSVPWSVLTPHEQQAMRNHGQSLECLAARGGLGLDELVAVLEDRPYKAMDLGVALDVIWNCTKAPSPAGGERWINHTTYE